MKKSEIENKEWRTWWQCRDWNCPDGQTRK